VNLLQNVFHTIYNIPELIRIVGQFGLPLIIFAETGLLVGFFLPGDSLLITAGLFAARGDLSLPLLIVTLIPAAILGNATGYQIGKRTGKALYSRPDSLLFRREHLRMTHEYYERHGGKTIKWLGDGLMFYFPEPGRGVSAALEMIDELPAAGLPPAHVGLAAGPVLFQEGDYFGQTVNLSARISDYARQGEVLVTKAVADGSAQKEISFADIGEVELKGVSGTVHLFRAGRA